MPLDEFQDLAPDEQATTFVINEKPVTDQDGQTVTKKIVKGGRLKLYPPGMNIVRSSKGVKRPTVEFSSYEEVTKKSLWANTDFQSGYSLVGDDGNEVNQVYKEYYNAVRKDMQE